MVTFARKEDGIPLVNDATQRAALFPAPALDQRVYNKSTPAIERYSGSGWVVDLANTSADTLAALAAAAAAATAAAAAATAALTSGPDGAVPTNGRTVTTLKNYLAAGARYNVKEYGAKGDGTSDDSAAFTLCVTKATAGAGVVYVPEGNYVVKAAAAAIAISLGSGVGMVGEGKLRSILVFRPTGANATCLKVTAGAAQAVGNRVVGIGIYSDDTTYVKTAFDFSDVSSGFFYDLMASGTGVGPRLTTNFFHDVTNASVGIRTRGREATTVGVLRIIADRPVYIDANPNTVPNDGEDMDHWRWFDCYFIGLGNYCVTVKDGLGLQETTFDGYQAWVEGTGGLYINDTRAAPTIPFRGLSIKGLRREQGNDVNGYGVNITCAFPAQNITIERSLVSSDEQGVKVSACLQLVLDRLICATAAGKNAVLVNGAIGGSTIDVRGCLFSPGSVVTYSTYNMTSILAWDPTTSVAPSTATYSVVLANSRVQVEQLQGVPTAGSVGFDVGGGGGGDRMQVIPQTATNGATLRAVNVGSTDYRPMGLQFNGLTFYQRNGAGTVTPAGTIDISLGWHLYAGLELGKGDASGVSGVHIFGVTGVPGAGLGVNGDYALRFDGGGAGATHVYFKNAGTWLGVA